MATLQMTLKNIDETISRNAIVVVDFWAPWCGPCRTFGPIFERVAGQFPDMVFAKVNTEEEQELAAAFRIRSIPTLMIFREGIVIFSQPGMVPEKGLVDLVTRASALDMDQVRREVQAQQNGA